MTYPLSIFIITYNEEARLGAVLEACCNLSDDIVIVDSGSTDNTLEIAKKYTNNIYHRDWEGFGPQKVYAESLCKNDWILNLDADEILLDEVKTSIKSVLTKPYEQQAAAYSLRIRYVSAFAKTIQPHPFSPINITPRLYNKTKAGFKDSTVHDKVVTFDKSKPTILKGNVAHLTFKSFSHMWQKIHDYAVLQSEDWFKSGRRPHPIQLTYDPLAFFLKNYFLRRMCFIGWEGFVVALSLSAGRAIRIGMTLEKWRKADQST